MAFEGMRKSPHTASNANIKATREDWINLALKTLISGGVDKVRVLTMSRELEVSRSSFYWYFTSRQNMLDQLLQYWRDRNTKFIVEHADRPSKNIIRAVMNVFECWVDDSLFDPQLDFAVRAWARNSKSIRRVIDEADNERIEALRRMFARHDYSSEDAFVRARVLYFMQIGYYALEVNEPMNTRLSYVEAYLRSFTGQEPKKTDLEEIALFVRSRRSKS
jgi:AcrR family transcriptional regulator